jgi:hypothetical protein
VEHRLAGVGVEKWNYVPRSRVRTLFGRGRILWNWLTLRVTRPGRIASGKELAAWQAVDHEGLGLLSLQRRPRASRTVGASYVSCWPPAQNRSSSA